MHLDPVRLQAAFKRIWRREICASHNNKVITFYSQSRKIQIVIERYANYSSYKFNYGHRRFSAFHRCSLFDAPAICDPIPFEFRVQLLTASNMAIRTHAKNICVYFMAFYHSIDMHFTYTWADSGDSVAWNSVHITISRRRCNHCRLSRARNDEKKCECARTVTLHE